MTASFPVLALRRPEFAWVLEQCGVGDWPYPLAATVWPADSEDETVLARARAEDGLRARGLLEPGPAAVLLAVGNAVRDRRRQVDLVRRSATTPCAAVALGGTSDAALLWSADHADADVAVRPLDPEGLVAGLLTLVPPLAPAAGPPLEVPATPDAPGGPGTVRGGRERHAVADVLSSAEAWTQIGTVPAPNGLTSPGDRADATIKWLDGPRGRYRLRHDSGRTHDAGRGRAWRGRARLVGEDATSAAVRAELEAALGPLDRPTSGRSTE